MSDNLFSSVGIKTKGIQDYRSDLNLAAKVAFADKLQGRNLRADDSSMLGRLFATIAKPLAQNSEILPLILQGFDINSAEGQQLDNLLWGIHRVKRKLESQAVGLAMLHGDLGVSVARGSNVGNELTGDNYRTDFAVTFSHLNANGVDISINELYHKYELSYSINGYLSESPSIVVVAGVRDTTTKMIAQRLVDAVNNQSSYLTASLNNDGTVKVVIDNVNHTGNFVIKGNQPKMSVVRSYTPVSITSSTYNSKESLTGQVSVIKTPSLGWRGVTNPYYIFPSVGIESDEEYRYRGKLLQQSSYGKHTSILMAIKSVRGVTYENIQQNTSSSATNSGIVNNGVAITVMGGNEDEIALAIFNSLSEGTMTSGDILKSVKDINGAEHDIRFSRPIITPLEISMSLITYPNFPNDGNTKIRQAIIEWFNDLDVGEDIHYSRLYEPINTIQGFAVKNLNFGYKGGTLSLEDVIIKHNEIATLNAEDIVIGGSRGTKNLVGG